MLLFSLARTLFIVTVSLEMTEHARINALDSRSFSLCMLFSFLFVYRYVAVMLTGVFSPALHTSTRTAKYTHANEERVKTRKWESKVNNIQTLTQNREEKNYFSCAEFIFILLQHFKMRTHNHYLLLHRKWVSWLFWLSFAVCLLCLLLAQNTLSQ